MYIRTVCDTRSSPAVVGRRHSGHAASGYVLHTKTLIHIPTSSHPNPSSSEHRFIQRIKRWPFRTILPHQLWIKNFNWTLNVSRATEHCARYPDSAQLPEYRQQFRGSGLLPRPIKPCSTSGLQATIHTETGLLNRSVNPSGCRAVRQIDRLTEPLDCWRT